MINLQEAAAKAASEFGLSLKDDPTAWPEGAEITAEAVRDACNAVAIENARSALSRALGKLVEPVAAGIEAALAEDGPLADLDAVLANHVEDKLDIDFSGVLEAKDWEERVEAVRASFAYVVASWQTPPLPVIDLMHYVGSDPRLDGEVMRTVALLRGPEHDRPDAPKSLLVNDGGTDWDDEPAELKLQPGAVNHVGALVKQTLPDGGVIMHPKRERGKPMPGSGRKRRTKAEIEEDEAAERMQQSIRSSEAEFLAPLIASIEQLGSVNPVWDDEDEPAGEAAPLDAGWDDVEPVATSPKLPALASIAGIQDSDMAEIMGIGKSYYSQIKNGKRPWPGLKPDQVARLSVELQARRDAISAIASALSTDAVLKTEL